MSSTIHNSNQNKLMKINPKRLFSFFTLIIIHGLSLAQFPPPAGQPGSTAIHKDSNIIVGWADDCIITRGFIDMTDTLINYNGTNKATYGSYLYVSGPSDEYVVSLGDRGLATVSFNSPIVNGQGPDFVVFENSFGDLFLELAFVEVSSDGLSFYRFPATSLTVADTQIGTFGTLDATKINNLAGKYSLNYGTPFDLQELDSIAGLDISAITHIKIIDVVGSITDSLATRDSAGNKINDPWPTPFAQGGFDLDAIGVIHKQPQSVEEFNNLQISVFPNPASDNMSFTLPSHESDRNTNIQITDMTGRNVISQILNAGVEPSGIHKMNIDGLSDGIYLLSVQNGNAFYHSTFIIRH
jgi:hypothetical protein